MSDLEDGDGEVDCGVCGLGFRGRKGLGQHMRRAHPVQFFENRERGRAKSRWGEDELRTLAVAELDLKERGYAGSLADRLEEIMPGRTWRAIKVARRKALYRLIRQELEEDRRAAEQGNPLEGRDAHSSMGAAVPEWAGVVGEEGIPLLAVARARVEEWGVCEGCPRAMLQAAVRSAEGGVDPWDFVEGWFSIRFPGARVGETATLRGSRSGRRRSRLETPGEEVYALWKRDRRAGLSKALGRGGEQRLVVEELEQFWRPLMEEASAPWRGEGRSIPAVGQIWNELRLEEIKECWPGVRAASGPDRIQPGRWRGVPPDEVLVLFMLAMATGGWPAWLLSARTTFVSKGGDVREVGNFRPITVGSVVIRHFHKVLVGRIGRLWPTLSSQMGFRKGVDGVGVNVGRVRELFARGRAGRQGFHAVLVDIRKAFDSVSHDALWALLEAKGVEREFIAYLKIVYGCGVTFLVGSDGLTEGVRVGRGVRQGDPLSGPLFNVAVDHLLLGLDQEVGVRVGGVIRQAVAYADDVMLVARTKRGLEGQLRRFLEGGRQVGLAVNGQKCVYVGWQWQASSRVMVPVLEGLHLGRLSIPALGWDSTFRYLGVHMDRDGRLVNRVDLGVVEKVGEAGLPAQAVVETLAIQVVPGWLHQVVLGGVSMSWARKADCRVREMVRRVCGLPKDLCVPFFHAATKYGGLGIPSLAAGVKEWRKKRWIGIRTWEEGPEGWGVELASRRWEGEVGYAGPCGRWADAQEVRGRRGAEAGDAGIAREETARMMWRRRLHDSVDGYEVREAELVKESTGWIRRRAHAIGERDWKGYLTVWTGSLLSLMRVSRGQIRAGPSVLCRGGCGVEETAAHIVQRCPVTAGGVRLRHHAIVRLMEAAASRRGIRVWVEVVVRSDGQTWRPDMVWLKGDRLAVVDVQVVSGSQPLVEADQRKRVKYGIPGVERAVREMVGGDGGLRYEVVGVTVSWRGVLCKESVRRLALWGVKGGVLEYITERALRGSAMNFNTFRREKCTR